MTLFIAVIVVILLIGVVVIVRGGEEALELDRQDHALAEKVGEAGDLVAPYPAVQVVKDTVADAAKEGEDSWTLDSVEDTSVDSGNESE